MHPLARTRLQIVVLAGHLDRGSAQDSWVNLLSLVRLLRMVRMLSISRVSGVQCFWEQCTLEALARVLP